MSGVVTMQLDELRERFGEAHVDTTASGTMLVTVPGVRLPHGWSKASTAIRFFVPPGYPFAQPDCFWADADLRLASGAIPQSSGPNAIPDSGDQGLWFSWHLTGPWDPNRDTLSSWMNSIIDRLGRVQ
jgi:hypothetical protein